MAAVTQGDRIAEQIDMLLQHPQMGRPGRKKGTRELVISRTPFVVVYRIKAKRIELLRVLHGSQQWPSLELSASRAGRGDGTKNIGDLYLAERELKAVRAGKSTTTPLADVMTRYGMQC